MKKRNLVLYLIIILLSVFFMGSSFVTYAAEKNSYEISYIFEESDADFIYFDISDTNICVSYDNDKIYEFSKNGDFIRIIKYSSTGNIYSYYKNNNLVIYDVRKNLNIVIDVNGNCLETFESQQIFAGYYIGDDLCNNLSLEKNGFLYQYINSNWFSRVFKNKKSTIMVIRNENITLKIEENFKLVEELMPIFITSLVVLSLLSCLFIKKRTKN